VADNEDTPRTDVKGADNSAIVVDNKGTPNVKNEDTLGIDAESEVTDDENEQLDVENENVSGIDMAGTDCDNLVGMIVDWWTEDVAGITHSDTGIVRIDVVGLTKDGKVATISVEGTEVVV